MVDEWGALCASTLTTKDISHKPLINYGGKLLLVRNRGVVGSRVYQDSPVFRGQERGVSERSGWNFW